MPNLQEVSNDAVGTEFSELIDKLLDTIYSPLSNM